MADVDALKQLVDQQIKEGIAAREAQVERDDESKRRHDEYQQTINNLLEEMARQRLAAPGEAAAAPPGDAAAARAAAAVVARAEKISKIQVNLRKSNKIKEFKESTETSTVKEWLSKFDTEINTLKKMAGIAGDLSREEIVELFKDQLEYQVVKRLDTAFTAKDPPWVWNDVTYDQLKIIMKVEYGSKITSVSEVLLQFGPSCYKKAPEVSIAKFTHLWLEQYPECMSPETEDELRKFADLVKMTAYYHCLEDQYIQKELCELSEADMNFKKFFDQAVTIESRRRSFQDIGASGAKLDPGNGITASKVETSGSKKQEE